MVQIIKSNAPPSTGEKFKNAIGAGLERGEEAYNKFVGEKKLAAENQAYKRRGLDLTDVYSPEGRKASITEFEKRQKSAEESEFDRRDYEVVKDTFGEKFANLWRAAPVGAKTQLIGSALEANQRGFNLEELLSGASNEDFLSGNVNQEEVPQFEHLQEEPLSEKEPKIDTENLKSKITKHTKEQDRGLLPNEKISRGKERFDSGIKKYEEAGTKLRSAAADKNRFDVLENLEKSGKLPKDLGRLNVDADGNLRVPFAASAESQRFIKTLNEFSQNAKDTFGSRVTNFDLTQYLKRFPTLLNSEKGRQDILKQMKIVNQINSVYYKNLKRTYDEAGGVRNIDADVAERFAQEESEDEISSLSKKFSDIGDFPTLPAASEFNGRKIRDKKTGEVLISNGDEWIPFSEEQ